MRSSRLVPVLFGLCAALPGKAIGQATPPDEAIRVFLDCQTFCDFDYLRREITWVNWVRDRQDAAVHLLITSQRTGGGGQEFTLRFIGLRGFQGVDDEIKFATRETDTEDEVRRAQAQRVALELARYVARGGYAERVKVTFTAPPGAPAGPAQQPKDPWNFWVFRVSANGSLDGESQRKSDRVSGSLRADRVTEQWKFRSSVGGSRFHQRQELPDTTTFTSSTSSYNLNTLLVRSLGNHWSLGLQGSGLRSTFTNYDLLATLTPEIEFDLFPYRQSDRRQFVFIYAIGVSQANYTDTTIYERLGETRPFHRFTVGAEAIQPWGSLNGQLVASSYLDDFSKNRLTVFGECQVRIVRGLNFSVFGSYSRVRDQLSLLKAGLSEEDVLLRLKELKTAYRYFVSLGLSYTFGSKFNNVVNPRFSRSGGGGGGCECFGGSCFCQ